MINNYTYTKPDTIDKAASEIHDSANGKFIAGGTDIVGVINEKIKAQCPDKLVSLKSAGSDEITEENGTLRIGAMAKLSDIEDSEIIREKYRVLWEAAHQVASPQIRHMATIGGNICQEPRCWYYRYQDDKFHCMRKGGTLCNAMMGENIYHSVFGGAKVCGSPCESQCPNGTAIPEYFDLIRKGDLDGAAKVLWEMNPLAAVVGRVCPHTCQSECNRNEYDEPVSIRNIERTVGDYMLEHAERLIDPAVPETGKKIAVIGAGPAGLTAAYFLRKAGHSVTVYDANEKIGGMLRYGIPAYRLPRNILDRFAEIFTGQGIVFKQNVVIGEDIKIGELCKENDAVFTGIGAWKSAPIGCPGDDVKGVIGGIEFLKDASEHKEPGVAGKVVAVVGGGNTAMDCCRTAKRLGAAKVYNFYRRTEAEMPAEAEEIAEAKEEGIEFCYLVSPAEIIVKDQAVQAVKLQKMELREPDESGRRKPVPIPGEFETIEVDLLFAAIGQKVDPKGMGLDTTSRNWIKTDADHATSMKNVFAAGDAAIGPGTAIEAIADGRKTADSIHRYLGGQTLLRETKLHQELFFDPSCMEASQPLVLETIPVSARSLDQEDNSSASMEAIKTEANRCYNCGCVAVSPSDTAPALIALDAVIVTSKREIPASEFFLAGVDTSTVLDCDEIVKEIVLKADQAGSVQQYNKFRTRETIDFPIAGLASNIKLSGDAIESAKLVFSGVAPMPYEFYEVEDFLRGKAPSEELAAEAGRMAIKDIKVLSDNKFKAQIIKAYVRRAVARAIK
ncbi:MAG: FAD-dependent oxidoreductase [Firmicutes bacterium]|jgi:NADPH-dependent glutamate synthase beta subunit-like oxidoreductase/CO/xanthine dehydrogenase FAD-binding subunit|nr:FAD-dependent oxidoreductase [Bacillota bacterium]NBI61608.1 FAD-dependent oxidoreductase [Clostridiales bacterium]